LSKSLEEVKCALPSYLSIVDETYTKSNAKALFIDKEYGEYWAIVSSVLQGHSHRSRGQKKAEQTNIEKYGCKNVFTNEDVKKIRKDTMIKRFGTEHALKNKELATKCNETTINHHGYKRIFQRKDFIMESSKKLNKVKIFSHWKTGEEIVATAGYEIATVEWLNKNQINYVWQVSFDMPNNKVYIVDLYLPDENKYVEIKGRWYEDAKTKWEWFISNYANSEVWSTKELKLKGIL
jgi:hypothetical protein